jgi:hypothetical protein
MTAEKLVHIQNVMKMVRTVPEAEQVAAQTIEESKQNST